MNVKVKTPEGEGDLMGFVFSEKVYETIAIVCIGLKFKRFKIELIERVQTNF